VDQDRNQVLTSQFILEWGMRVNLNPGPDPGPGPRPYGQPIAPRRVLKFENVTQFDMPNGTVTVIIDRPKGLMEIFAEPEPDPVDWELTCGLLSRMGLSGQLQQGEYLKGIDVWRVSLKGRQAATQRTRATYSTRAMGAVAAAVLACLPLFGMTQHAAAISSHGDYRDIARTSLSTVAMLARP
jgi:hypothetical protein